MKKIPLTQGKYALIDDEDFELVSRHKWWASIRENRIYAKAWINGKEVYMHRLILGVNGKKHIDHIDGDARNNRRSNLRFCTQLQNNRNMRKSFFEKSSKYKGVSWDKWHKKWHSCISKYNKSIHLGFFKDAVDAAAAYDVAALEQFGEFALTNFEMVGGVGLS